MKTFTKFLVLTFILFLQAGGAGAQRSDNIPSLDFTDIPDFPDKNLWGDLESAGIVSFSNPYLRDNLLLQYQISLVEQLIERETRISQLQRIYGDLGQTTMAPPLPDFICRQIPPNIPCIRSYPDLYSDYYDELAEPEELGEQLNILIGSEQDEEPQQALKPFYSPYVWKEINCSGGRCFATILNTENMQEELVATSGEILPDGSKVAEVTSSGIVVTKNNNKAQLLSLSEFESRKRDNRNMLP